MSNLPGVNIPAGVRPYTTGDQYDTHDATYGKGGWRAVADLAARDAIPVGRRSEGMAVHVVATGIEYILGADLTTWTARPSGGTVSVDQVFADEAERDAYFLAHPEELTGGIIVAINDMPSGAPQYHTVDATLGLADLKAVHYLRGAVEITLPEITPLMVAKDLRVLIYKDTTAAVNIITSGSDLIVDADNLGETSANAEMFVELIPAELGLWKVGADRGAWASV
jgi:hypothetical protein